MSRLVWMGIGAAGGIYAYRKGQHAWERTKERGVTGTATLAANTAIQWYGQVRDASLEAERRSAAARSSVTAQGEVIDLTDTAQARGLRSAQAPRHDHDLVRHGRIAGTR